MPRFDRLEFGPAPPENAGNVKPLESHGAGHWLKQADLARRQGLYENTMRFYSRALEENKAELAAWLGQVQMLILLREYPEADLWARKSLELFASNGDLLAARAQAACRLGDKRQAFALCDAAMEARDRSAYRWQVRGELMLSSKQSMDEHCFDKAEQLDRDWLVPLESSLIYLEYAVAGRAYARARKAVERAPQQFYAWYVQGCAEQAMHFRSQAAASFRHCLQLCANHHEAKQRLTELSTISWTDWLRGLWNYGG